MYKLFIDDIRNVPGDDWVVARSSGEAISILKEKGLPDIITFDHDLGGDDKATIVTDFIIESLLDGNMTMDDNFRFFVHSDNPEGKKNLIFDMKSIYKQMNGSEYPYYDYQIWLKNGDQDAVIHQYK